jgi:hypothetical protein
MKYIIRIGMQRLRTSFLEVIAMMCLIEYVTVRMLTLFGLAFLHYMKGPRTK